MCQMQSLMFTADRFNATTVQFRMLDGGGYLHQRGGERQPGALMVQDSGGRLPRPVGGALLLCVASVCCWEILGKQVHGT